MALHLHALRSNKGFTLIEAMIAVAILVITTLWSLQGLISVKQNVSANVIREEAVKLGQELLTDARVTPYAAPALNSVDETFNVTRQIASYDISFTVRRLIVVVLAGTTKSVEYTIGWDGGRHSYIARTLVSDQ